MLKKLTGTAAAIATAMLTPAGTAWTVEPPTPAPNSTLPVDDGPPPPLAQSGALPRRPGDPSEILGAIGRAALTVVSSSPEVRVPAQHGGRRPVFVLHEHDKPQHHFDLRLEEDGVLKSWAVPRGLPTTPARDRLAVPVADHDLDHATYQDETKSIADTGWWELEDRNERRTVFVLHGSGAPRRYALVSTDQGALLHLVKDQPAD